MTLQNVFARTRVIAHLESGRLGYCLSGLASALSEQRYAVHTICSLAFNGEDCRRAPSACAESKIFKLKG